jgi:hypothetical protein
MATSASAPTDARRSNWATVLNDLAARVERQRMAVAEARFDRALAEVWTTDNELGPMPAELRSQAESLLDAMRDLEAAVTDARDTLARRARAIRAAKSHCAESTPLFVDRAL